MWKGFHSSSWNAKKKNALKTLLQLFYLTIFNDSLLQKELTSVTVLPSTKCRICPSFNIKWLDNPVIVDIKSGMDSWKWCSGFLFELKVELGKRYNWYCCYCTWLLLQVIRWSSPITSSGISFILHKTIRGLIDEDENTSNIEMLIRMSPKTCFFSRVHVKLIVIVKGT